MKKYSLNDCFHFGLINFKFSCSFVFCELGQTCVCIFVFGMLQHFHGNSVWALFFCYFFFCFWIGNNINLFVFLFTRLHQPSPPLQACQCILHPFFPYPFFVYNFIIYQYFNYSNSRISCWIQIFRINTSIVFLYQKLPKLNINICILRFCRLRWTQFTSNFFYASSSPFMKRFI